MMPLHRYFSFLAGIMRRRTGERLRDQSGSVLIIVSVSMVVLLAMAGLALDMGRGYVTRARLVRALDAGVLTGARTLRKGQAMAEQQSFAVAAANGFVDGQGGVSLWISFSKNAEGEQTVTMGASQPMPTVLMHLLGRDQLMISAASTAAVPPVDLVLVIDQSYSLHMTGSWDELQDASRDFVDYFDDEIDQMGVVSYHTLAAHRFMLDHGFTSSVKNDISNMDSRGYTNTAEGLRLALEQITSPAVRDRSAKVVVFFTDGRPTAFRTTSDPDRMVTIRQTNPIQRFNGYYDKPESLDLDVVDHSTPPDGCSGVTYCEGVSALSAYEFARQNGLDVASQIRAEGMMVYTIGLGDPNADPYLALDQAYLNQIANVDGMVDPSQPAGRSYFAPSAAQLEAVFNQVAQDLLVRLSK